MKTLPDVLNSHDIICPWVMERGKPKDAPAPLFTRVQMDGVVVLSDQLALRYLEQSYVMNTHFAPGCKPGAGLTTGDVIWHDSRPHLTIDLAAIQRDMAALHFTRKLEPLYVQWCERRNDLSHRLREVCGQMDAVKAEEFGVKLFQRYEQAFNRITLGPMGLPSPEFLRTLKRLAKAMKARKKKGTATFASTLGSLIQDLQPYSSLPGALDDIQAVTKHRSAPRIQQDLLTFSSPMWRSSNASMSAQGPSDNFLHIIPSTEDLVVIAMEAGNLGPNIRHLDGGNIEGEHYFMLLPRTPFFDLVQRRVEADTALVALWREMNKRVGDEHAQFARVEMWHHETKPAKQWAVLEAVPGLIADRVLGLHVSMTRKRGTATIRPVVAESHYLKHRAFVERKALEVVMPNFASLFGDTPEGYGPMKSVFDEPPKK
jgi:hypothetical protein